MSGVHPDLVVGPSTEIIAGNGLILTAGAIDCHVHLICPQIMEEALGGGITTIIGGGTGPAEGTKATTVTPGAWHLARMLEALDPWPVNIALLGKGNTVGRVDVGAVAFRRIGFQAARGLGLHAGRHRRLPAGGRRGRRPGRHPHRHPQRGRASSRTPWPPSPAAASTPTTPRAPAAGTHRTSSPSLASRTCCPARPTRPGPHTVNTLDEHLDMLMVCHHLNPSVPEDLAFAESRIRPSTIAAEDLLHDIGAISMIGSDSQAMGRIGEVVLRTWQTAHVMKKRRGALPGDGPADNNRRARYVAKYTICPAVAHGLDREIGSVEVGKLADLVLWEPAFFGVRPHVVLKGGMIAWAAMGDANASIPTPQPVLPRPMFGAAPAAAAATSVHFVAPQALEDRPGRPARGQPPPGAGGATSRQVGKADMPLNDALPRIEVDPDTFTVRIDGEVWQEQPADRTADGTTLLPVLAMDARAGHPAHPGRLAAADRWARALRRRRGGGHRGLVVDLATLEAFLRRRIRTTGLVTASIAAAGAPGRPRRRGRRTAKPMPAHRLPPRGRPPARRAAACSGWPARLARHRLGRAAVPRRICR